MRKLFDELLKINLINYENKNLRLSGFTFSHGYHATERGKSCAMYKCIRVSFWRGYSANCRSTFDNHCNMLISRGILNVKQCCRGNYLPMRHSNRWVHHYSSRNANGPCYCSWNQPIAMEFNGCWNVLCTLECRCGMCDSF